MPEPLTPALETAIRTRVDRIRRDYTSLPLTHSESDREALLAEVDRLRAELIAATRAVLELSSAINGDLDDDAKVANAQQVDDDYHRAHGWTSGECTRCTALTGPCTCISYRPDPECRFHAEQQDGSAADA